MQWPGKFCQEERRKIKKICLLQVALSLYTAEFIKVRQKRDVEIIIKFEKFHLEDWRSALTRLSLFMLEHLCLEKIIQDESSYPRCRITFICTSRLSLRVRQLFRTMSPPFHLILELCDHNFDFNGNALEWVEKCVWRGQKPSITTKMRGKIFGEKKAKHKLRLAIG